ncbi:nuclear transport factor 2 family protein [Nocardia suismassiliense]|uniref:Nuclear transport factor 2 family protein n=1 Tax=Nocardia suismassiliense TaxID=2077092 RepID=A0ABW6R144_9NOCA
MKRRIVRTFGQVSDGDYQAVLTRFDPEAVHWFSGQHALGGTRDNIADIGAWYARWEKLLPDLKFEVTEVVVSGWPWATVVAVEWVQTGAADRTANFRNTGVHLIRLRWGRTVSQRVHCDTAVLAEFLRRLQTQGVREAVAAPIGSAAPPPQLGLAAN